MSDRRPPPEDEDHRRLPLHRPGSSRAARDEIEHHLEERADRLVEEGWDPEEAREEAERRFGDVEGYEDELAGMGRRRRGRRTMTDRVESVVQDVRHALRGMRRNPVFAGTVVLTLALGIGAAAAVFSVVDAVMLRALPYERPDELVTMDLVIDRETGSVPFVLADQVEPWREAADFFTETAYEENVSLTRTDGAEPELLVLQAVSHDLDDVLGVQPRLGRAFGPDDVQPGRDRVILLSHGYWSRTGADPEIVGREVRLEGEPYTVVGVLPRSFKYPVAGTGDAWIPLATDRTAGGLPVDRMQIVGRLRPGVTVEAAQERADALAEVLQEESPTRLGWQVRLSPVGNWRGNPEVRRGLWLLAGAVGLMLVIALANGLNLLLVRAGDRRAELAVRRAVGASRRRLLGQLLTESVLLSLAAGLLAVGLAAVMIEGMRLALPDEIGWSSVFELGLEERALLFVFLVATGSGLVVGILPAAQAAGRSDRHARDDLRRERTRGRLRNLIIATEIALSVALLGGAGLFLHSFTRILRVDPGFDVDRIAVLDLGISERAYPTGEERRMFLDGLAAEIGRIPGVTGVAVTEGLPPDGGGVAFGEGFQAEGREPLEGFRILPYTRVRPGFHEVLGMEIAEGRAFRPGDEEAHAAIIDRDFARDLFGPGSAVGKRYRLGENGDWHTVVGVVDDLKLESLEDRRSSYGAIYPAPRETASPWATLGIRTAGDPSEVLGAVRRTVHRVDPTQPIRELATARRVLAESVAGPRFLTLLLGALASVATVLAAVGVYGVLSYLVARRSREMGIRMALGASRRRVRGAVLRSGLLVAAAGSVAGLGLALLLSGLAEDLLFQVEARDPLSLGAGAAVMLLTAGAACWVPARRATRVDPVETLKAE